MQEKIHYYVVAENSENVAYLDDCKTQYEADMLLDWYKAHKWLFADDIKISVKNSKQFF